MKKIFTITITLLFTILGGQLLKAENLNKTGVDMKNKKVLVVYYSLTGNTKVVAEEIQKNTGGDIFELQTIQTYPADYKAQTEQAKKEINDGYKPILKNKIDNIDQYNVIFVGSPCWWSTYAPAVSTFLADYNLSGKTLVPFMTHEGSGMGRTESDMKKNAPNSKVLNGLAIRGGRVNKSENEIKKFVDNIKNN